MPPHGPARDTCCNRRQRPPAAGNQRYRPDKSENGETAERCGQAKDRGYSYPDETTASLRPKVILVLLLYRQFGLMIMPGSHRVSYGGLDVGASAPVISARPAGRAEIAYTWTETLPGKRPYDATFALFAMPGCPLV